jgi:hypothetical protein
MKIEIYVLHRVTAMLALVTSRLPRMGFHNPAQTQPEAIRRAEAAIRL